MIKLSLKGLASYMTSGAARQRKILRDFKYPDPEGKAQALYYREARNYIAAYHAQRHPRAWLADRATVLLTTAYASSGATKSRLENNARALNSYERNFGDRAYDILNDVRLELRHADVRVTIVPDLHVQENDVNKLVKFDFSRQQTDPDAVRIMSQATFDAATKANLGLPASCVLYCDVPRGTMIRGARMGVRLSRDIQAACENISAIWGTI